MSLDPRTGAAPSSQDAAGRPDGASEADRLQQPGEPTISAPTVGPSVPVSRQGPDRPGDRADVRRPPAPPMASGRVRYEARQVQRVVTRVDPWSVLKVAMLFAMSVWLILVVAGVILWRVAVSTDTIGKFENFMAEILVEPGWVVDGMQIFRASAVGALVLVVTGTVFAVVFSVLFNLIAGLTGGLRFSVIELETARRADDRS
jgi:hypothetical protein